MMESPILHDIERQINCLHQLLTVSSCLKEKCVQLEKEKNEAQQKCSELKATIERLNKEQCGKCTFLMSRLKQERKEKEKIKKEEKAKLFKAISKTLENLEDGNTNQMTNAHQLFTELICGGLATSPERKEKKVISLIEETEDTDNEDHLIVLANETVMEVENEESLNKCHPKQELPPVVVPESQQVNSFLPEPRSTKHSRTETSPNQHSSWQNELFKENRKLADLEIEAQHVAKKKKGHSPNHEARVFSPARSPSVLSEIIEAVSGSNNNRSTVVTEEDKGTSWKMKPSLVVENNAAGPPGKKLKQMTLSLARPAKKHDISSSEAFNGGIINSQTTQNDVDKDIILPSPERSTRRICHKRPEPCNTMVDPDETIFQPPITSTCLPVDTSFDRLPERPKSPLYKYRRETVRKRDERMKLPGQDCDHCARYYEAAGLDKTNDVRERLNTCSRHRDKYQIRANTPPGFWDPVLPTTPSGSQE